MLTGRGKPLTDAATDWQVTQNDATQSVRVFYALLCHHTKLQI